MTATYRRRCWRRSCGAMVITADGVAVWYSLVHGKLQFEKCPTCKGTGRVHVKAKRKVRK